MEVGGSRWPSLGSTLPAMALSPLGLEVEMHLSGHPPPSPPLCTQPFEMSPWWIDETHRVLTRPS